MKLDASSERSLKRGFHDDPIIEREQDSLRRTHFADRVVALIDSNHRANSSVVYGLEGPWGSGKSSVINMIRQSLKEGGSWKIAEYTPWATSDYESLFEEFFAALAEAAPELTKSEKSRKRLLQYAALARPLSKLIPAAAGIGDAAVELADQALRRSWKSLFSEISKELQALDSPILIVVDDIDRLQATELLDLLKVIRLLGRFPGIDFLLAYDEDTVVDTLSYGRWGGEGSSRGRAFMEKIVQYPLSLPPLLRSQIVKMLETGFSEILGSERTTRTLSDGRILSPVTKTMPKGLGTPRAIQRFLAQVQQQFESHAEGEIDEVDLILATFLRMQFPELYAELENWKQELTRQAPQSISLNVQESNTDWEPLLTKTSSARRRIALEILEVLFPVMAGRKLVRRDIGRFAHPDYFDRYLAQTVPGGDISDGVINEALELAANGEPSRLRGLLINPNSEDVPLVLSKICDRYPDVAYYGDSYREMGVVYTRELFACGMSILDELPDRYNSWTNERTQCTYWLASLLGILLTEDSTQDLTEQVDECESIERRAHVLSTAARRTENLQGPARGAIRGLMDRETERLSELLLKDLRERDNASGDLAYSFLFDLVCEFGDGSHFQDAIREGVRRNEFTLEDVAARHVSFSYTSRGAQSAPWAATFSAGLFTQITGVPASEPDFGEKGTWEDRSLLQRREFARRYIQGRLP